MRWTLFISFTATVDELVMAGVLDMEWDMVVEGLVS